MLTVMPIRFWIILLLLLQLFSYKTARAVDFTLVPNSTESTEASVAQSVSVGESVILVGAQQNYPPFIFENNGKIEGISVDLLNLVAKKAGLNYIFTNPQSIANLQTNLDNKEIDVITSITPTTSRLQKYQFTEPYFQTPTAVFTLSDFNEEYSDTLFDNRKVAMGKGYGVVEYFSSRYPNADFEFVENDEIAIELLTSRKVEFVVMDIATANYLIRKNAITNVKTFYKLGFIYNLSFAVLKDNPTLVAALNYGLSKITQGERDAVITKWVPESNIHEKEAINPGYFFLAISVALFIVALGVIWNVSLQKIVRERTAELENVRENLKKIVNERTADLTKFKAAVENAYDHIIISDINGKIIYANKAVTRTTGFTRSEIFGNTPALWGKQMSKEFYDDFWNTIKFKKESFVGEVRNRRKNGEIYNALISVTPILDKKGEVLYFIGIERDVTKEREVERMKSEFISLASHQLRTPLSATKWYLEVLADEENTGKLTNSQREILLKTYDTTNKTIALVNNLLNVSRIESGKIFGKFEKTNLCELVEGVVKDLGPLVEEKKIEVIVSIPKDVESVYIDPKIIREVYSNLLSNAIKYSATSSKVIISTTEDVLYFLTKVQDFGIGIPLSEHKNIFSRFYRAQNAISKVPDGNGLGLYIAKIIVEAAGGRIWFESVEGEGTTFYFTLPKKAFSNEKLSSIV